MENGELLLQIAAMMEEQTKQIQDSIRVQVREAETRINIKIEHDVTKRIDALFDGYQSVHEKQWALEHRMDTLEERLERVEVAV